MEHKFPQIKPHPFNRVPPIGKRELILDFPSTSWQRSHRSSQEFTPNARLPALDALTHAFFDELRDPATRLPDTRGLANGNLTLPPLFNFTPRGITPPHGLN